MMRRVAIVSIIAVALQLAGCGAWKRFIYEGFDCDDWQKPDGVIALLGLVEGAQVAALLALLSQDRLTPIIAKELGLEEAAQAHELLSEGSLRGRIMLVMR